MEDGYRTLESPSISQWSGSDPRWTLAASPTRKLHERRSDNRQTPSSWLERIQRVSSATIRWKIRAPPHSTLNVSLVWCGNRSPPTHSKQSAHSFYQLKSLEIIAPIPRLKNFKKKRKKERKKATIHSIKHGVCKKEKLHERCKMGVAGHLGERKPEGGDNTSKFHIQYRRGKF